MLWPSLFRSGSRHLKAPARACWTHQSTLTPPIWPPRCPSCLLQDLEMWLCSPGCSGSQSGDLRAPARGLRTRHLDYFQLLTTTNRAGMNIVEHVSLLHTWESSGYMPRNGIAGSSGSVMLSFQKKRQTDFQSSCTNCIPTSSGGVSLFLHILANTCCLLSF